LTPPRVRPGRGGLLARRVALSGSLAFWADVCSAAPCALTWKQPHADRAAATPDRSPASKPAVTRMRAAPTSTTSSEEPGGGAVADFGTSLKNCGGRALESRVAQYRSVETARPSSCANCTADTPLARHALIRSDHTASRCAVDVVMRRLCDQIRSLGRYASSCSAYLWSSTHSEPTELLNARDVHGLWATHRSRPNDCGSRGLTLGCNINFGVWYC
jgi:hypothetical protein